MKRLLFFAVLCSASVNAWAISPDWSRDVEIHSPRENLYQLPKEEWNKRVMEGRKAALFYPVTASQLILPYRPLINFFDTKPDDRVRQVIYDLAKVVSPFKNMGELYDWLGLHKFPETNQIENPNPYPELSVKEKALPMGATLRNTPNGEAITFGCASCHTSDLFGVKVMGLTNRFPRANEFFRHGAEIAPYINSFLFQDLLKTTEGERLIYATAKNNLTHVGVKKPVTVGLDTSLAQVGLSLSKRNPDAYATHSNFFKRFPRKNKLETLVADSKPLVWWNVKHKNRWLSDGSIVSGNPVHTNFLWNEIGRGTDLKDLEKWMIESQETIENLTAAVFASRPPRYEKFFGVDSIDIEKAQRGERHFVQSCQKCHGVYTKGWERPQVHSTKEALIQTVKVTYHKKTPVIDVGTDPGRHQGMWHFAKDLNRLAISKTIGTVVEAQKGYVPPPLEGIWARWPYFHNNSIPSLCALLTAGADRPVTYYAGKAIDKNQDFDQACNGYPLAHKAPKAWKVDPDFFYDTRKEGLSNRGHDEKIFLKDGKEIYSMAEKLELIEFLKTL